MKNYIGFLLVTLSFISQAYPAQRSIPVATPVVEGTEAYQCHDGAWRTLPEILNTMEWLRQELFKVQGERDRILEILDLETGTSYQELEEAAMALNAQNSKIVQLYGKIEVLESQLTLMRRERDAFEVKANGLSNQLYQANSEVARIRANLEQLRRKKDFVIIRLEEKLLARERYMDGNHLVQIREWEDYNEQVKKTAEDEVAQAKEYARERVEYADRVQSESDSRATAWGVGGLVLGAAIGSLFGASVLNDLKNNRQ